MVLEQVPDEEVSGSQLNGRTQDDLAEACAIVRHVHEEEHDALDARQHSPMYNDCRVFETAEADLPRYESKPVAEIEHVELVVAVRDALVDPWAVVVVLRH